MTEPSDNANPRSCAYMHKIQLHGVENRKKKKVDCRDSRRLLLVLQWVVIYLLILSLITLAHVCNSSGALGNAPKRSPLRSPLHLLRRKTNTERRNYVLINHAITRCQGLFVIVSFRFCYIFFTNQCWRS